MRIVILLAALHLRHGLSLLFLSPLTKASLPHSITKNGPSSLKSTSSPQIPSESPSSSTTVAAETYGIIGHNIAYSVSPQMHNTAFRELSLPHTYTLIDIPTVDEFFTGPLWTDDKFRGASVTIPHKLAVIPYVDELSDAARDIGSVNTLQKRKDGTVFGDNTDWIGLRKPMEARLKSKTEGASSYALILGGGGTARAAAYAAKDLGLERIYNNRTPSKAEELAESFGGTVVTDLSRESLGGVVPTVVISTLPAGAGFTLPEWILEGRPIVFDVNYKPYYTALSTQAEAAGCDIIRGSEMLWEQGVGQFELWMGREAPYEVMKAVVLENCLPKEEL